MRKHDLVPPFKAWKKRNPAITQFAVSAASGVHSSTLSLYGSGRRNPELEIIIRLQDATSELTGGADPLTVEEWVTHVRALQALEAARSRGGARRSAA